MAQNNNGPMKDTSIHEIKQNEQEESGQDDERMDGGSFSEDYDADIPITNLAMGSVSKAQSIASNLHGIAA